jgi:flagellar hook-length control protein FliK
MHGDGVQPPIASGIALAKPVAVQTASVVQWAVAGVPDRQLSASVSPDVLPMDAENLAIGETHGQPSRGDVAAVSLAGPVAQPRAELARSIAAQIAETSVHSRGRSLDISLHPEELGKVRISVTQTDAGYAITIQADRQETADLMRRYQHLLESEMRGAGFAKVDVDVSGQGGRSPSFGTSQSEADTSGGTQEIARETPQAARPKPQVSGLDVRV